MSGYSTIEMNYDTSRKVGGNKWLAAPVSALCGLVAGLAIVSYGSSQSALYTAPATRAVQAAPVHIATPGRYLKAQPTHMVVNEFDAAVEPTVEVQSSTAGFSPALLLGSAAALGLLAVKMLTPSPQVSMMSTTAVKRAWAPQSGKKYKTVAPIIAPSLLAADLANLAADSKRVLEAGADVLHVDVMDGHFVPNLSWGAPVIKCLRQHTNAFFDTHLMVSNPEDFIAPMADAGVDQFTFHIEAAKDPKALIKAIKDAGMKVGISVKPKTPVDTVFPYVEDVDLILVMTVEPGFGGQSFMEDMMPKVKTLREKYPNLEIQVDGGLGPKTIDAAAKAGANAIVAGSACFVADPKSVIDAMRDSLEKNLTGPGI